MGGGGVGRGGTERGLGRRKEGEGRRKRLLIYDYTSFHRQPCFFLRIIFHKLLL